MTPADDSQGPLTGTVVLDLSTVGPATRCSRALADYGADVIKIGPPLPSGGTAGQPLLAYHAYSAGRLTRQARINLRSASGIETFLRLVAVSDVILESFRPGVADRLGIGYDAASAANPGIVYCSTSGYGQTGPHAARAGHDLNYLAAGGYLYMSGRDETGAPALPGATVADIAAGGLHAATAILAALVARSRTGQGTHLDVAVTDGVAWMLSLYIDEHLATGEVPAPGHSILTGRYACYGVYGTGDGRWIAVAAIEPRFWANLCRALDLERWIPHQLDDASQDDIRAAFRATFATADRDTWIAELADADTCVAPVNEIPEVAADPQLTSRGAVVEARHPTQGTFPQLAPVLAGSIRSGSYDAPHPGHTHTDELLRWAGCSAEQIQALRDEGVVE